MSIINKTSELATIITTQFENSRLQAEAIDQELGRHKFIIGTKAPNIIAIQVPEVIQVDGYTSTILNIVDSIILEDGCKVTEPIEIHIYGPNQEHIDSNTIYPTSKE